MEAPQAQRYCLSRLLTPGTSLSGHNSSECGSPRIYSCTLSFDEERNPSTIIGSCQRPVSIHSDDSSCAERTGVSQHAVEFQQSKGRQAPTLPPIQTVLNDHAWPHPFNRNPNSNMASLPKPTEPSVEQGTFRPPALYPNQRTATSNVIAPFVPTNSLVSPQPSPIPSVSYSNRPPNNSGRWSYGLLASRRPQIGHERDNSDVDDRRFSDLSILSVSQTSTSNEHMRYHRPQEEFHHGTPGYDRSSHGVDSHFNASPNVYHHGIANRDDTVPSSTATGQYNLYHVDPYSTGHQHRPELRLPPRRPAFGTNSYGMAPNEHLSAPQYDYPRTKSRKRSNLPKQSTDIMKRWFDQNMDNPYPDEYQKEEFSRMTGISLTQVSNWFINHRRRCPELRESRERKRR